MVVATGAHSPPGYADAARAIATACAAANSEMTVAARFEAALVPLLSALGVDYQPQRERRVVASKRRIDSQFGAVVTEYKHALAREADWREASDQLVGYVKAIAPTVADRDGHVGVVTDGRQLGFITFCDGEPRLEQPGPLDGPRLRRYVETLVALGRRGLTQEHLVEDFAASAPGLGRALAAACYAALGEATAKTGMLQSEWQRLFARSVEHRAVPRAHQAAYAEALGVDEAGLDASRALFALQTAYAVVVKLVAARVLSELHLGVAALRFDQLAASPDAALREQLERLEEGHVLRESGLENLLEGDFFSWYVSASQWTPELASALRAVIHRLCDYEGRAPLLRPGALGDMFRLLYQRTIPAAIRHDLGEYYTPRWLAQAVLADLPAPPGWRGLDPCCGSGTFVVEMIAEVLEETAPMAAAERLTAVLRRVAGIDLNPLAVLTARVNYFLAVAPLIGERGPATGPVAIPVYLGDAAAPAEVSASEAGGLEGPERLEWEHVRARLAHNFDAIATLGAFERVAGNPPWVEWKDLPDGYRETIHGLCRGRGLFSDDAYAGGTDLNISALIAHTALERFVVPGGYMGFLMPHQLLQVRSAQGLRRWRLPGGEPIALRAIADWSALKPFDAACQPVTYLLQRGIVGPAVVPVRRYRPLAGEARSPVGSWRAVRPTLQLSEAGAAPVDADGGPYMIDDPAILPRLLALLGPSAYRGRRATETSPHGVFWVRPLEGARPPRAGTLLVENAINPRAKEKVAPSQGLLETAMLHPFLRGAGIAPFKATPAEGLLLFPHTAALGAKPVPEADVPPLTLAYLRRHRAALEARGSYKEYRSKEAFYGMWRVGPYSFAPHKVVWPEMGELRAAVVGVAPTPWGEAKMLVPEGKVNMVGLESAEEAHYLCGLLNAPLIRRAYRDMSSQIGRPSRLPFAIPPFDGGNWSHRAVAAVSKAAHAGAVAPDAVEGALDWLAERVIRP